ncbi:TonB-dependent receptor [Erythrobacter insulae]|uniref:TonB-dependent receptor n=1 Tax=Erythrobacter insulae TaxID=2584124 RepID=A0A547P9E1_9SPHN|nr:TonB-dependent receptor [Erythrobacter insulae]TRD10768.1 TonB-dependent receptor [Erythrobacter insulae]
MKKLTSASAAGRARFYAGAGLAAMSLVAVASPAAAQDQDDDGAAVVDVADNSTADAGQSIVVTGSRIRNPNVENLEPTQFVDDTYIQQRNFINAADALNDLPIVRGSVTPDGNQGSSGVGVNFINIFGLGSQRSLTLLNGRRVVSSNSPANAGLANPGVQVDVNIIPTALIERIDVVSIGGAPVYGSDAIAGTVNYILKDDFEGLELGATSGITEEGDSFRFQFTGTFGTNFADGRGNITVSSFYSQQEGLLNNQREFLRAGIANCSNETLADGVTPAFDRSLYINPNIAPDAGAGDGNPGFVLCPAFNVANLNQNGVVDLAGGFTSYFSEAARANNFTFNPDGTLRPYQPGIQNRSIFELGGDSFQFPDFEQVTSDLERFSTQVYANYDLTDNATLFFEGMYFESVGTNLVEQPGFNSTFLGGRLGAVTFRLDNPLLTDQARSVLARTGQDTFRLERVNLDLANTSTSTENQLMRFVGGVRGEFDALGDLPWNYEVSLNYGRSKIVDLRQDINLQNYVNSLNECRTDLTFNAFASSGLDPIADAACVPVSLFGANTASAESIDYITFQNRNVSTLEQYVFNANVGGDLFKLFDNSVSFNVGYEFRREEGFFDASEEAELGRGIDAAVADVGGAFEVNEVFGEVFVPVITPSNDFFINRLDVFGRGRYVDNSINGGFFAWSAGGAFGIVEDVTFRGNYTKSFRAPAIAELFAPQIATRGFIGDFCAPGNRNAGAVPETRNRNCTAFLGAFPNATPLIAQNVSVPILTGGNPSLRNEVADSFTFGVVIEPRWIPNLAITVDYIDIEIADPIVNLTAGAIAGACFDNENFDVNDPANGNQFCSLIRRDADGQVVNDPVNPGVTTGTVNGALIEYSGIESTMNYRTSLDGISFPGDLSIRGSMTYVRERITSSTGVNVQRSDATVGDPEFRAQLGAQYTVDNYGIGTVVNYTGEQLASRFNRGDSPNDTREFDQYDDFVTVDMNVFFQTEDDFRFNFNVTNLLNRQGQEYFGILIPAVINDAFGRRFTVNVTKAF